MIKNEFAAWGTSGHPASRMYALQVSSDGNSASERKAWTQGMGARDYVRRCSVIAPTERLKQTQGVAGMGGDDPALQTWPDRLDAWLRKPQHAVDMDTQGLARRCAFSLCRMTPNSDLSAPP